MDDKAEKQLLSFIRYLWTKQMLFWYILTSLLGWHFYKDLHYQHAVWARTCNPIRKSGAVLQHQNSTEIFDVL